MKACHDTEFNWKSGQVITLKDVEELKAMFGRDRHRVGTNPYKEFIYKEEVKKPEPIKEFARLVGIEEAISMCRKECKWEVGEYLMLQNREKVSTSELREWM